MIEVVGLYASGERGGVDEVVAREIAQYVADARGIGLDDDDIEQDIFDEIERATGRWFRVFADDVKVTADAVTLSLVAYVE